MKRRKFIKSAAAAGIVVPTMINGIPLQAHSTNQWLSTVLNPSVETDHVLVIIQMNGGNDGLNTVVPLVQLSKLNVARPNVVLKDANILKLNGTTKVGLHPSLTGFQTLYNEGKLNILQSVGYPSPNFSHFASTDIWASGRDSDQFLDTGWVGRYLNEEFPGFPLDYPNAVNPDPLAVQIGGNIPLMFQGPVAQMSMNVGNPDIFGAWPNGISDPTDGTPKGKELNFIRTISRQSKSFADALIQGYLKGNNVANYPTNNYLADTLKVVARVVKGGMKTRMFLVSIGNFDTHADQVDSAGTHIGAHANLLKLLGDAVLAFQRDLEAMNLADRVIGMTFSEFGRRIKSNDSNGTDHGAAAPLFVFGKKIQGGVVGANPILPAVATVDDNVPMQYDFRSVYSSILKDWFCVKEPELQNIMLKTYQNLPIVKNECSNVSIDEHQKLESELTIIAYPNPMVTHTEIKVKTARGYTQIQLIDALGRLCKIVHAGRLDEGSHTFRLNNDTFAPGNYYLRIQQGNAQKVEPLMIVL